LTKNQIVKQVSLRRVERGAIRSCYLGDCFVLRRRNGRVILFQVDNSVRIFNLPASLPE